MKTRTVGWVLVLGVLGSLSQSAMAISLPPWQPSLCALDLDYSYSPVHGGVRIDLFWKLACSSKLSMPNYYDIQRMRGDQGTWETIDRVGPSVRRFTDRVYVYSNMCSWRWRVVACRRNGETAYSNVVYYSWVCL